jgi:nitric oxide reductase subunit C
LRSIGVKPTYSLDLGKRTDLPLDLPPYLNAKLTAPRSFFDNLRMPVFKLNDKQVTAIVTALLSCGGEDELPAAWILPAKTLSRPSLHGAIARLLDRYACLTCHTIEGFGGPVAPELSVLGSQLETDWIKEYLGVPFSRRPILMERMPNLFLSQAEKDTLIQYFKLVFVSDEIDREAGEVQSPERIERGKSLFYERFACYGCHQVGGHGGYVGPPLDGAGKRLKAQWVRKWLENPQLWKPETVEPKTTMSADELSAVAAYVMSL